MSYSPEFERYGYHIDRELGSNRLGGRLTYQGTHLETGQSIVIKQFQFATGESSWAEFEAYEQEIEMLRRLQHPGIPRYLDSFQMTDGFCMVQEYLNAESLAIPRSWTPQQVKDVAISTLKILVYLQSQKIPVIHRDLKPENILIDEDDKVYLVDFGFARMGGGEISASSVVKGTMGFMPPEQLFNRQLTQAADLYGLGVTLICLLTGTKSVEIGNLMDAEYRLHFRHLVPPLKRGWMSWLEKMVEPKVGDRYACAQDALSALESIDVEQLPRVRCHPTKIEMRAEYYGEKLTQIFQVDNPVPNTLLAGRWEVAPHPSDPPHTPYDHSWISFSPMKFEGNAMSCEIRFETHQLLTQTVYKRQLILHTNSSPENYFIPVMIQTANLPKVERDLKPLFSIWRFIFILLFVWLGWGISSIAHAASTDVLLRFGLISLIAASIIFEKKEVFELDKIGYSFEKSIFGAALLGITCGWVAARVFPDTIASIIGFQLGAIVGSFFGYNRRQNDHKRPGNNDFSELNADQRKYRKKIQFLKISLLGLMSVGFLFVFSNFFLAILMMVGIQFLICLAFLYLVTGTIFYAMHPVIKPMISFQKQRGLSRANAVQITLLAAGFSLSLGIALRLIAAMVFPSDRDLSLNLWVAAGGSLTALVATGMPFIHLTILKPRRMFEQYTRSLSTLIQP